MKEKILNHLLPHLESSISSFQESINELKEIWDIDENSTIDPDDLSQQNESKDMEMRYNLQLQQAKNDLIAVKQLMTSKNDSISLGALIDTDKKYFFIGISNPVIDAGGKELICVSTKAPAYAALEGKKPGDNFQLGKESYTISNIY
ncbi:MAG: hypothetical protein ACK5NK_00380 [Niabella sp.]